MLDRIEIQIEVPAVPVDELQRRNGGESSDSVRMRVSAARDRMLVRQGKPNAMLESDKIETFCSIDAQGMGLIELAIDKLGLSARSYHRTLKVARSITDLAGSGHPAGTHVAQALGYRRTLDERLRV